jgi:uncharacterized protein YbcC (UPF0753/DUF2309 family)
VNETLLATDTAAAPAAAAIATAIATAQCAAPSAGGARLAAHIAAATARIAPTWPLDEFIAVNPYWGWVAQPMAAAAAQLGVLAGTQLTMPRDWFRQQWQQGRLQRRHLEQAVAAAADAAHTTPQQRAARLQDLLQALDGTPPALPRLPLVGDLRDRGTPPRPGSSWAELLTHQISQHCAAYFDHHQAAWGPDRTQGLLGSWMQQLAADRGLPWRQGRALVQARLAAWPTTPQALLAAALDGLGVPDAGREAYCTAALMSVGGWAAWCAYLRWQARLAGRDDDTITHLLAVRVAWDWLLLADAAPGSVPAEWAAAWAGADAAASALQQAQHTDWLLQAACEAAYQQPLVQALQAAPPAAPGTPLAVQAVFCIDVRSEVFRRALEGVSPAVQTRGFAGFFGLPIAYSPLGSALTRPQLPGLLAPAVTVSDSCEGAGLGQALTTRRRRALQWRQRWAEFRSAPASAFSMVESLGLLAAGKLLAASLPSTAAPGRWESTGLPRQEAEALRPCLPAAAADPAAAAAMAKGILGAMGMLSGFAPLVLLAGHGSQTANNPHAAGLDCGACGGQTGEVNARVLAGLLNDSAVRAQLRALQVHIPDGTHFLPGLHNTTTDDVQLFDLGAVPAALQPALAELQAWLAAAGQRARAERAPALGLQALAHDAAALQRAVQQRANDWAQVRPEWGLADCAAFIVAPRQRTRHLHLAGRSFLHDYDHRLDPDLAVLTLIMTAPMVVTNWINMQYHASTVDNRRYGSGTKALHNVVGGNIGVFEGNGGDLRIGLPLESLHDGATLRHTPLRLSVFIEAPQAAIDSVMAAHSIVQQLVGNGWLHLFRIDPETSRVTQYRGGAWHDAVVGG